MNNLSSYCGLVDAKMRASDKDLPVQEKMSDAALTCDQILNENKPWQELFKVCSIRISDLACG